MTARGRAVGALLALAALGHSGTVLADDKTDEAGPGESIRLGPLELSARGFFRAPLRFAWRCRMPDANGSCPDPTGDAAGGPRYNLHTPWLIDDDYFRSGFAYTRLQEQDYAELYLGVGNQHLRAEIALMNSLFSDWARPLLENQLGIAQAFLRFNWDWETPRYQFKLSAKAGAFWDRFGWMQAYDTYLFGRTHQLGGQIRGELTLGPVGLTALYGFGAHLEAIDVNQGLTLLNYLHLQARYRQLVQLGFYFLDNFTHDKRQLSMLTDADMQVSGLDLTVQTPWIGKLWIGGSLVAAQQATFLAPALEVLHSYGGRGVTENFLGTDKSDNGTGNLWNLGFEGTISAAQLLGKLTGDEHLLGGRRDIQLRYFGLYTRTNSIQKDADPAINKDGREYFKWGLEPGAQLFSWLGASLRYDRVVLDLHDEENSFRVLTPRVFFTVRWHAEAQIIAQYSHYWYGARATLRPGQVPLETLADRDVFKLQAQVVF